MDPKNIFCETIILLQLPYLTVTENGLKNRLQDRQFLYNFLVQYR